MTQATCWNVRYESQALAIEMGADKPDGIDEQLESPVAGSDAIYRPDSIDPARLDLLDAHGVKPTACWP